MLEQKKKGRKLKKTKACRKMSVPKSRRERACMYDKRKKKE